MSEHERSVNNEEERVLIYKHAVKLRGHKFKIDELEILANEKCENPRKMLDALHRKRSNNSINRGRFQNVTLVHQIKQKQSDKFISVNRFGLHQLHP